MLVVKTLFSGSKFVVFYTFLMSIPDSLLNLLWCEQHYLLLVIVI